MSALADLLMGIFRQPTHGGVALEPAAIAAPLWLAALVGLLVGWAWHPRWAVAVVGDQDQAANPPAPPPRATATTEGSCRHETTMVVVPRAEVPSTPMEDELPVNTGDLMHLRRLVEEKDGGPSWIHVMERTLPTMRCQAWRRDPEVLLFHHEDTGIPCEIAKLGVRQGMRNCKAWLFMTTGGLACASSSVVVSPASMVQSEVVSPTGYDRCWHVANASPVVQKLG